MAREKRCLRVLSINGGGMRGLYTSTYLSELAKQFAVRRKVGELDIGKGFDLIVGTSTGGIIACALVAGIPLGEVSRLYRQYGKEIFPVKMPSSLAGAILQIFLRPKWVAKGSAALERELDKSFGGLTVGQVHEQRHIALAVPAVEMSRHRSWVFKTPHLDGQRDDDFRLVDVCLATSAAPLYMPMARVKNPTTPNYNHVFVDGGLWGNNPVLVGMIDALRITKEGGRIEIFSMGTCERPHGDVFGVNDMYSGLKEWKFGAKVVEISLDAQEGACENMARILSQHIKRDCIIVPFPHGKIPAKVMPYLQLDETSEKGMQALIDQALADVSETLSTCDRPDDSTGNILSSLLNSIPPLEKQEVTN